MFKIRPKSAAGTIRTIEQEMKQSRAKYEKYLAQRTDDFVAKRSNVEIRNPRTMAGNTYSELREQINRINQLAQKENKELIFEDARVLLKNDEFASPTAKKALSSQILVTARDKSNGLVNRKTIDRFELSTAEFLNKIADFIKTPIKFINP